MLDHIITSHSPPTFLTGTISCDITDHLSVFPMSNPTNQTTKTKVTRTIYNEKQVFHSLTRENWQEMYSAGSNEENYNAFIKILRHMTVGKTTVTRTNFTRKPWITTGLLHSINHKNNTHKKLKRQPHDISLEARYKRCNNHLNTVAHRRGGFRGL